MNRQAYEAFTAALVRGLERDTRVLGLMAAGSMAGQSHQPDEWSDHDFWLVVQPDAVAGFRGNRDWLPHSDRIVLMFADPVHDGVTVIYDDAHLLEFAVSDRSVLLRAKVNDYRLLIDRAELATDIARLQRETAAASETAIQDDICLIGQFLTNVLVGAGRFRRGEHLSARRAITVSSLYGLLPLIAKHVPADHAAALDNLDPLRRFEMAYPDLAAELNALLQDDLEQAAVALIDMADRLLRDRVADYPVDAVSVVRRRIVAAIQS